MKMNWWGWRRLSQCVPYRDGRCALRSSGSPRPARISGRAAILAFWRLATSRWPVEELHRARRSTGKIKGSPKAARAFPRCERPMFPGPQPCKPLATSQFHLNFPPLRPACRAHRAAGRGAEGLYKLAWPLIMLRFGNMGRGEVVWADAGRQIWIGGESLRYRTAKNGLNSGLAADEPSLFEPG